MYLELKRARLFLVCMLSQELISPVRFAVKGKNHGGIVVRKDIVTPLSSLGSNHFVDENTYLNNEEVVCRVYSTKSDIKTVAELRWLMFKKSQLVEGLPPTRDANYQCVVWMNDIVAYTTSS